MKRCATKSEKTGFRRRISSMLGHDIVLSPGRTLVLFTDGVNEALDGDDEEFGMERVATLLDPQKGRPAAEQASVLLNAVRSHRGARQGQDYVTVIVIRSVSIDD